MYTITNVKRDDSVEWFIDGWSSGISVADIDGSIELRINCATGNTRWAFTLIYVLRQAALVLEKKKQRKIHGVRPQKDESK